MAPGECPEVRDGVQQLGKQSAGRFRCAGREEYACLPVTELVAGGFDYRLGDRGQPAPVDEPSDAAAILGAAVPHRVEHGLGGEALRIEVGEGERPDRRRIVAEGGSESPVIATAAAAISASWWW
ncbi:MAG: hypothetical protein JJLCMIEE_03198 [Acidimicrobiales bacterium]|nr:hypothetical protein [Acidimicrobiales bacterium]